MAIFSRRPLAVGCTALILAIILSEALSFTAIWVLLCVGILLFLSALLLCFLRRRARGALFLLLLALGLLVGGLRILPLHLRERTLRRAVGCEVAVSLAVRDILSTSAYGTEALVDVTELDGTTVRGRAILRLEEPAPFVSGDTVSAVCTVMPLDADNYVENQHMQYRARGAAVQLYVTDTAALTVSTGSQGGLQALFARLRVRAASRICEYIPGEVGALAAAMLLGERVALSGAVISSFRYAGVSHLLALSGLHLGILSLLAEKFLLSMGLSRRWRILLICLLLLGYLTLTGFSLSLLRAALMLVLLQLSFLLSARADALTSLFLACAAMLLASTLSLFSASFQMTMLATFGILTVGRLSRILFYKLRKRRGIGWKLILWVLSSLLLTLAAALFVYPIQYFAFGEVSLITPLSNLLMIPLAMPFLYLATFTLCLYPAPFFGRLAGLLGNLILRLSNALGHPDVMLSLRGNFVPYLVLASLVPTVILLCVRLRRRLLVLLPHAVCTLIFLVLLLMRAAALDGKTAVIYGRVEKTELLLVRDSGQTLLVDTGKASGAALSIGVELLHGMDCSLLDYYLLPDARALNENRIAAIARHLSPRNLLIPKPESEERLALLSKIAAEYGITLVAYVENQPFSVLRHTTLTVSTQGDDRSVQITGQSESLLYQSGALVAWSDVRFHIASAGGNSPDEPLALGGTGTTVVVGDEKMLRALLPVQDVFYILFPEKQGFLLQ